jgi:hypothetical protein
LRQAPQTPVKGALPLCTLQTCHCGPFSRPSEEKARQSTRLSDHITPPRDCFVASLLAMTPARSWGTPPKPRQGRVLCTPSWHSHGGGNPHVGCVERSETHRHGLETPFQPPGIPNLGGSAGKPETPSDSRREASRTSSETATKSLAPH